MGFSLVKKLIDISSYPVANVLHLLLQDKSTKRNIIWATDTYEELGEGFTDKVQMNANLLIQQADPYLSPHTKVSGSTGGTDAKKSGGVHSSLALQSDEQLL